MIARQLRTHPELLWMALFVSAWGFLFLLRSIPLGGEWSTLENGTVSTILLWVAAVVVGMAIGARYARARHAKESEATLPSGHDAMKGLSAAILVLSLAAATGAVLVILEFAFVRGYGFSTPVANIRILEVTRGMAGADSSLLSGPGRLMLPAFLPAFLLVILFWRAAPKPVLAVFFLTVLIVLLEQILFEGGRFFLGLILLSLTIAVAADMMRIGWPPDWKRSISQIFVIVVFGSLLVLYSAWVFGNRTSGAGETQTAAFDRFSSSLIEKAPPKLQETPPSPAIEFQIHPTVKFFWIYATHGISQLEQVLRHPNITHTYGFFQFPQLAQIADKVFRTSLRVDYYKNMPSSGFYTTMIGASIIDFGRAGSIIFALFFGVMTGYCAVLHPSSNQAKSTSQARSDTNITFSVISFPALMTTALVSPIVSLVNHMWPAIVWSCISVAICRLVPLVGRRNIAPQKPLRN